VRLGSARSCEPVAVGAGQSEVRDQIVVDDLAGPSAEPRELSDGSEPNRDEAGYPRRSTQDKIEEAARDPQPLADRLTEHQARAELPAGSRRTIAASRIEAHRAGAVALQAVEHTDPDAVVGGPVRGGAARYSHGHLQVVGELPVAGAFVAHPQPPQ
jgi:hypothetical protein